MLDITIIPKIPKPGDVISQQYELRKEIGRGAMGVVFEAHQLGLERRVAIKMLLPRALVIEGVVERFVRGGRLASALTHPNAVMIHAIGLHQDPGGGELPYLVMECLDGDDLYDYITRKGRLTVDEATWVLRESLGSLAQAHAKGIIHRDLKPENLFVCRLEDGSRKVKVLDFGLAKAVMEGWEDRDRRLTATGMTCGTPEYMAPEQAVGEEHITPALDIYGLGCILYHMVTGAPPFSGKSPMTLALKHVSEQPPPLPAEFSGTWIEAIVERSLAKRPEVRFRDAADLSQAIEQALSGVELRHQLGWPTPDELTHPYRVAPSADGQDVQEDLPAWALGTVEMKAVDLNEALGLPTSVFERVPSDIDSLEFDDASDTSSVTVRNIDVEMPEPSEDAPYRAVRFDPNSVSVNIPDAVTVDLEASNVMDYSLVEGAKTVVTPPNHRPKANPPLMPTSPFRAPIHTAPSVPAAPSITSVVAPVRPAPRARLSVLWILVAMTITLGVAALTLTVLFFSPLTHSKAQKTLDEEATSIAINSEPPGAEIFEGDKKLGRTPLTIERKAARRVIKITLKKAGYRDHDEQIPLNEDSELTVELIHEDRQDWTDE